jgi:transketolase
VTTATTTATTTTMSTAFPKQDAGTPMGTPAIDNLAINTIRTLSMDAVQAADSGHPGAPMGLAPVAYALWQETLRYDPMQPKWANRDRFVLSNGHASMLLYSLLHLAGVQKLDHHGQPTGAPSVPLEELKRFRQLGSVCPGHPESHLTTGVETTTGPLGQGLATSVGMAIASQWLGARYNRPGYALFDYRVWTICGDGCLMEGISTEAASLAGHLGLSNLCWIYDSNRITIEGKTDLAYSDDVAARFAGYGWNVLRVGDANDLAQLARAYESARRNADRPTMIIVDSHIGYGSPKKQDTAGAHGEPLGEEEIKVTKRVYGWPEDAKFLVPDGVRERFAEKLGRRGAAASAEWNARFEAYAKAYPWLADEVRTMLASGLPEGWDKDLKPAAADAKGNATRNTSGAALNAIAKNVPWVIGGSADLAPSTKTLLTFEGAGSFQKGNRLGRNLHFGVREHAMAAVCNGLALSGLRPYGAGFLIFSDYARGAIRLSSIMELPVLHIFTHDSIYVGEDGPTHQPIEQLVGLRAIPGMHVFRPCDANEVNACWRAAMRLTHHPAVLALTRQNLPTLDRSTFASADGCERGAYVLSDAEGGLPDVILIGTGSEVHLCLGAKEILAKEGVRARVVSMPCTALFDAQDEAYRTSVLPGAVRARVTCEASSTIGWDRYAGLDGECVGMTTFGASAPAKDVAKHFGFTPERVADAARVSLARVRGGLLGGAR